MSKSEIKLVEDMYQLSSRGNGEILLEVFDIMLDGVILVDHSGTILYINPAGLRMFGYESKAELIGTPTLNLYAKAEERQPLLGEIYRNGKITDCHLQARRKDGSYFWVSMNARIVKDQSGNFKGFETTLRDINDRKLLEKANMEISDRFQRISDHIPGVIYQYRLRSDGSSHFPYASPGIKKIYGISPEEVIEDATPVFRVLHPDDLERVRHTILDSARNLSVWQDTYRVILPSGNTIWVEGNSTPQQLDDGSILWHGYIRDITHRVIQQQELMKAKEKAEESDFRLKLAVDSGSLGIWEWNLEQQQLIWNDRMYELYGIERKPEQIGLEFWVSYLHPEDREQVTEAVEKSIRGECEYEIQFRIIRGNGQIIYLQAHGIVLRNSDNKPVRMIGINRDITKNVEADQREKKYQAELQEARILLQTLIDSTGDLIWSVDAGTLGLLSFNRSFVQLFRTLHGVEVNLGMTPSDLLPNEELSNKWYHLYSRAMSLGFLEEEYKLGTTDMYLLLTFNILYKDNKAFGISVFAKDISERKMAEAQLRHYQDNLEQLVSERTEELKQEVRLRLDAESTLRISELKYRSLVDYSSSIVLEWDNNGNIIFLNQYGLDFLGLKMHEIIGRNVVGTIVEPVDSDGNDLAGKMRLIERHPEDFLNTENENVKRNGEKVWIAWTNKGVYDDAGNLLKIISVGIDHTRQHEMERALIDYRDLLEEMVKKRTRELLETNRQLVLARDKALESDRLKSAFLANLSHEIRTPMNGILGFLKIIDLPDISSYDKADFLKNVQLSSERLMMTINNLVELSKIEIGDIRVHHSDVKLTDIMHHCREVFTRQAQDKGLLFEMHEPDTGRGVVFRTDKDKLNTILVNLAGNAIKFTERGGVEVGSYLVGGNIVFYVKDTGIGIPETMRELIFERFVQIESGYSRGYEGSGIGLSIAKAYADALQGNIRVESVPGVGSTFYLTLPCLQVSVPVNPAASAGPEEKGIPPGKTLLIAEEDEVSFNYLQDILGEEYDLIHAFNGNEAVEKFYATPDIELIMMNLKMNARYDGLNAIRIIRTTHPDIPIIAQMASALESDKIMAASAGCNDFIIKPYDPVEIKAALTRCLV